MESPDCHKGRMHPEKEKQAFPGAARIGYEDGRSPENHHLRDALTLSGENVHVTVP